MKRLPTLSKREDALHFGLHRERCETCRYWRVSESGCWTAECMLLGRTLAVGDLTFVRFTTSRDRVCDGWKRRPKTWSAVLCKDEEGHRVNPHWNDPYITRESLERIRARALRRAAS